MSAPIPELSLKRRADRRIRSGHPWVFSNEVDVARSPLDGFEAGAVVDVRNTAGTSMGIALLNPHTLICARMLGPRPEPGLLEVAWFTARIDAAARQRERWSTGNCHRVVHGESDGLPGVIIDRYADVIVVQIGTAGMERHRSALVDAIRERLSPRALVMRNDISSRRLEGLTEEVEVVFGEVDEPLVVDEGGACFRVWPITGQKTGWYLDQRENRLRIARYSRDAAVLDCFSHGGGWSVRAALAGARAVTAIDSSSAAVSEVAANATANGVADRVSARRADVFEALRELHESGERFDVVVLDPPALIPRRKDIARGEEAYRRLNRLAMRVMTDDAVLVTSSCSHHLGRDRLQDAVRRAGLRLNRRVSILEEGGQGSDHPVHPSMPESEYLRTLFARVQG